jgi:hypothetical protein
MLRVINLQENDKLEKPDFFFAPSLKGGKNPRFQVCNKILLPLGSGQTGFYD